MLVHVLPQRNRPARVGSFNFDKISYSKSITTEQGTSPCSCTLTKLLLLDLQYWPFAYAQGIQSDLQVGLHIMVVFQCKLFLFISNHTEPTGKGRFLPIVYARQFYSPHLYHASHFGLPLVGLGSAWLWWGELARLKRGWPQVT